MFSDHKCYDEYSAQPAPLHDLEGRKTQAKKAKHRTPIGGYWRFLETEEVLKKKKIARIPVTSKFWYTDSALGNWIGLFFYPHPPTQYQ